MTITADAIRSTLPDIDANKALAIAAKIERMKAGNLRPVTKLVSMPMPVTKRTPSPCRRGKPGNELAALLKTLGIDSGWCLTGCKGFAALMNQWGVTGCRARRAEIVQRLEEQQRAAGWSVTAKAAGMALVSGLAFEIDLRDPLGWLVDEAIRRAEAVEKCESGACGA